MDSSLQESNQNNNYLSLESKTSQNAGLSNQDFALLQQRNQLGLIEKYESSKQDDEQQQLTLKQQEMVESHKQSNSIENNNQLDLNINLKVDFSLQSNDNEEINQKNVEKQTYEKYIDNKNTQKKSIIKQNKNVSSKLPSNDPAFQVSDQKVWAVSGVMPGFVSKKFIRSYKVGRYNKVKSLKIDMEYYNSPHHEQLHLGNDILPFQKNKSRYQTTGSFDYRHFVQIQNNGSQTPIQQNTQSQLNKGTQVTWSLNNFGQTGMSQKNKKKELNQIIQVFTPRTTAKTVRQQVFQQNDNSQNNQILQQQMEIKQIDIVSQPIIKQTNFINNNKCPHGLTQAKSSDRKNIFFLNSNSNGSQSLDYFKSPSIVSHTSLHSHHYHPNPHHSSKMSGADAGEYFEDFQELFSNKRYRVGNDLFADNTYENSEYPYSTNKGLSKQNIIFQPRSLIQNTSFHKNHHSQQHFSFSQSLMQDSIFSKNHKRQSQKELSTIQQSQPRLPTFAVNPDNITFLPKAKKNLVQYVNQIGTQPNPLRNTFVSNKQIF